MLSKDILLGKGDSKPIMKTKNTMSNGKLSVISARNGNSFEATELKSNNIETDDLSKYGNKRNMYSHLNETAVRRDVNDYEDLLEGHKMMEEFKGLESTFVNHHRYELLLTSLFSKKHNNAAQKSLVKLSTLGEAEDKLQKTEDIEGLLKDIDTEEDVNVPLKLNKYPLEDAGHQRVNDRYEKTKFEDSGNLILDTSFEKHIEDIGKNSKNLLENYDYHNGDLNQGYDFSKKPQVPATPSMNGDNMNGSSYW